MVAWFLLDAGHGRARRSLHVPVVDGSTGLCQFINSSNKTFGGLTVYRYMYVDEFKLGSQVMLSITYFEAIAMRVLDYDAL